MGKCLHRVSDHMTGSVGFDSSWESREEERVQQYTHSTHSHFHDRVRGSVTENYCIGFLKLLKLLYNCFLYISNKDISAASWELGSLPAALWNSPSCGSDVLSSESGRNTS